MAEIKFQSIRRDRFCENAVAIPYDIDRGWAHALGIDVEIMDDQVRDVHDFCAAAGP